MEAIKEISWLESKYLDEKVRVIDCRFKLGEPNYGKQLYNENHIPGAVYFHLEEDLSGKMKKHGGRHPLPEVEDFANKLEKSGIENDTTVVVYDGGEGAFAARCWWILKYIGHKQVYILNEGYQGWKERGLPVSSEVVDFNAGEYHPEVQGDMIATVEDVRKISRKETEGILIDSRARKRYLGMVEPIDKIPGHIPGAVNHEWTDAVKDGSFLSKKEHEKRWNGLDTKLPIIVYCGSGVTATPNILSLWAAGCRNAKLYPGSYSDWISYEGHEVEAKNEND
ncbi:sulfurtransferase [Bacillus sp. SG-1]|uniref:sulfurtransferase n=1 Tax=Bacillus sp. SG-1 TaxID=161544 RepID=UPI0001544D4F|nr:sulfurtransferase [Bacillus sp. SG-1]EDL63590.1 Thiosulfate sulfurtransferase [Bacillus sp. SG-1]